MSSCGRAAYLLFHAPLAGLRRSLREGGPWQQFLDHRGADAMRRAAWALPPTSFGGVPLEVHLLTGRAHAWQSLFCVWSLAHAAQRDISPVFHDDGTLAPPLVRLMQRVFPAARFRAHGGMETRLNDFLPLEKFPVLRGRFIAYPHIRKLINVHLGKRGWKLVLDSDLLFFRRPDFLLRWLEAPQMPLHLRDVVESYGYPRSFLEDIARVELPVRLNVGLCGWRSEDIDWQQLEAWCAELLGRHGTHYLLEQALVAMMAAGQECAIAPSNDYVTMPSLHETQDPRAVMHHYVALSKRGYFRHAWKRIVSPETLADKRIAGLVRFEPMRARARIDHDRHF